MRATPTLLLASGQRGLAALERVRDAIAAGPDADTWRPLLSFLHLSETGKLASFGLEPDREGPLESLRLEGLDRDQSAALRFASMTGPNLERLANLALLPLRHHLHRTELMMELARDGRGLEPGMNFFILAPAFDPLAGADALAMVLAIQRLQGAGLLAEAPSVHLLALLPDLWPEAETDAAWARTYEFFRELQALHFDARLLGAPSRFLELDLHVFALGRVLSSGVAVASWEDHVPPIATLIKARTANLLELGPPRRDAVGGKPAFLHAFGWIKFFYPREEIDRFLLKLVERELAARLARPADRREQAAAAARLREWAAQNGLADAGLEAALETEAGFSGGRELDLPEPGPAALAPPEGVSAEAVAARELERVEAAYRERLEALPARRQEALAQAGARAADRLRIELEQFCRAEIGGDPGGAEAGPALGRGLGRLEAVAGLGKAWLEAAARRSAELLGVPAASTAGSPGAGSREEALGRLEADDGVGRLRSQVGLIAGGLEQVRALIPPKRRTARSILINWMIAPVVIVALGAIGAWAYLESAGAAAGTIAALKAPAAAASVVFALYLLHELSKYRRLNRELQAQLEEAAQGSKRLAEAFGGLARAYQGRLWRRARLLTLDAAAATLERVKSGAAELGEALGRFRDELAARAAKAETWPVKESVWEISLGPSDLLERVLEPRRAELSASLAEAFSPDRFWGCFMAHAVSGDLAELTAALIRARDRAFKAERGPAGIGDRLKERLSAPEFRALFQGLLEKLGVGAVVVEDLSCPSKVHKSYYCSLAGSEDAAEKVVAALSAASGLSLQKIDALDGESVSVLPHWQNFAAFQLAPLEKARRRRDQLAAANRGDSGQSALGPDRAGQTPRLFPVAETLSPEEMVNRELAVVAIAAGWVEPDWERQAFALSDELDDELKMADQHSFADFIAGLARPEAHVLRGFLAGERRELEAPPRDPKAEARRAAAWKRTARLLRQYDEQGPIFRVLELEDYETLKALAEKLAPA